jgi:hypothetical protein
VIRADRVDRLTAAGWSALQDYGVRTIIDLRNEDEVGPDVAARPATGRGPRRPRWRRAGEPRRRQLARLVGWG